MVVASLLAASPVLLSNKVNIWLDIIEDGAGLVEPDTLEGVEKLLGRWINSSTQERKQMQLRAKQCFLRRYEIHAVYERLMSILEQAVAEARQVSPAE